MSACGLKVQNLSVVYEQSGRRFAALDDVDLELAPGDFLVVVGSNGAGKSTLAGAVAGSVRPTTGHIVIGDRDVTSLSEHRRAALISRVVQDPRQGTAGTLTVRENLALARSRGRSRSFLRPAVRPKETEVFTELLAGYGRDLGMKTSSPAGDLSGGQRQVLALAMSVLQEPTLLLLDEHTSALDPEMAALVMEQTNRVISDLGVTTVMITHNMKQAVDFGNRLAIMNRGRFVREIGGAEKIALTENSLIDEFRNAIGGHAMTDELLG